MTTIAGFLFMLVMVFGGYTIAGGKFGIILHSLPYEMMMIGGAAIGAFLMANSMHDVKHTLAGFWLNIARNDHHFYRNFLLRNCLQYLVTIKDRHI